MNDLDEIERILGDLSRKAPPAGLKRRVLSAARRTERETLFLRPVFRTAAALCLVFMAIALVSDLWVAKSQTRRLSALLEHSPSKGPAQEARVRELLAELGDEDLGRALTEWMLQRYRIQDRTVRSGNISEIISRIWEELDEK